MPKSSERLLHIKEELLELLIFKKLSVDRTFAHSFLSIADESIFSNRYFTALYKFHKSYYRNHPNTSKCVSLSAIKGMLKPSETELENIIDSVIKVDEHDYDNDLFIHNVDLFVRNRKIDYGALYIMTQSSKGEPYDLNHFQGMMNDAFNSSLILDLGLDYFGNIDKRFEEKKYELLRIVDTGIRALQHNLIDTNGGLAPKTLTVVNGQSNIGKSILLGNIALNAWKSKKNVVIVTCEMSENAYAGRLDAAISKTNTKEINDKKDDVITKIKNEEKLRKESGIRIKEFPTSTLSPATLRSYLTQLKSEFEFDLVVVDYINIMISDRATEGDNLYARIKQISEDLRGIAVVFDVPVLTATQLNRSGYNNGAPGMENTAESMGVVVTADVMIGIWQDKEDKVQGVLNGILMKNRYGPNDIFFQMGVDYETLRIVPEWEKYINPDEFSQMKKKQLETGKPSKSVLPVFNEQKP